MDAGIPQPSGTRYVPPRCTSRGAATSVVHHGSMKDIVPVYEALVQWIEDSGYRLAGRSRELYLEFDEDDHSRNVTELQMPIAR